MIRNQKTSFIFVQIIFILTSFLLIAYLQPTETGWWIFKETQYYLGYFAGTAFIIMGLYLILLTSWYENSDNSFDWKISTKALLLCGTITIVLSLYVLYPLWDILGFYKIEINGWFSNSVEIVARDPFFHLLDISGAIAGPIEELAKLLAVLLIPSVRKSIKDGKSGLYIAVLCAIGFATIENIKYFSSFEEILLIRANPAHAVFSAIWGKALGDWFNQQISFKEFLKYLFYGMMLHGAWNYFASCHEVIFIILSISVSFYGLFWIHKKLAPRTNNRPIKLAQ